MAKRQTDDFDDDEDEEPKAAEPTPEPEPAAAEDDTLPYRLTSWSGLPLWECKFCAYATTDGEYTFYKHLQRHLTDDGQHAPPSGLVDPSGKPLGR